MAWGNIFLTVRFIFNMKESIYRNIEGKKVLLLFVLTNIVYVFMLTVSIPWVMGFSDGMKLFDMMPLGYDPEYALLLLDKLGAEGRHYYLYNQLPVDMIYPLLFAITYSMLTAWFLNKLNTLTAVPFYLCILPILAGLFDYLENLSIINMLQSYPHLTDTAIQTGTFFTVFKSLFSTISFTVLIVLMIRHLYLKLSKKK